MDAKHIVPTEDTPRNPRAKDTDLHLRISSEEREKVVKLAACSGMSVSSFIRMRVLSDSTENSRNNSGERGSKLTPAIVRELRKNFNESAKDISRLVRLFDSAVSNGNAAPLKMDMVSRMLADVVSTELAMQESLNILLASTGEAETHTAALPSASTPSGALIREILSGDGPSGKQPRSISGINKLDDMIRATVFGYLSGEVETVSMKDGRQALRFDVDLSAQQDQSKCAKVTVVTDKLKMADSLKRGRLVLAEGNEDIVLDGEGLKVTVTADRIAVHSILSGVIDGNLTGDAEAFTSKSGIERVKFRVAADGVGADGEKRTQYVYVVMHRDDSFPLLKKGVRVIVDGTQDISVATSGDKKFLNISMYADAVSVIRKRMGDDN